MSGIVCTSRHERLAEQMAALVILSADELDTLWQKHGPPAPNLSPDQMRMGLAFALQAKVLGKERAAVRAVFEQEQGRVAPVLTPGTQLVRDWNGRTIMVLVTDEGFLFEGTVYRSLTAIARQVTGAHWSGPRFFGVKNNG